MSPSREHDTDALPDDDPIARRARAIFGSACEHSDSHYALRLRLARRDALDNATGNSGRRTWIPMVGAVAACCALAIGITLTLAGPRSASTTRAVSPIAGAPAATAGSDKRIDVGSSQQDMVEDLDFYRWLATQPAMASVPASRGRTH